MDLDHPTIPTCPTCGALPTVTTGVTATVTLTADGNATIVTDLSELYAAADGEWVFDCPEGTDHDDPETFAEASHDLERILDDIGRNCEPSLDYTIGSGTNRA